MEDGQDGSSQRPTYELALRAIGAYLDDRGSQSFNVIETPEGFAVRYSQTLTEPDLEVAFFSLEDLSHAGAEVEWVRKVRRLPAENGRMCENLLRAVGSELDQARAMSILIDQLQDALVITYAFDDPSRGFLLRKRMAIAGPRDCERLLKDLRARRKRFRPAPAIPRWRPRPELQVAGRHHHA